jgi:hypothetical protein
MYIFLIALLTISFSCFKKDLVPTKVTNYENTKTSSLNTTFIKTITKEELFKKIDQEDIYDIDLIKKDNTFNNFKDECIKYVTRKNEIKHFVKEFNNSLKNAFKEKADYYTAFEQFLKSFMDNKELSQEEKQKILDNALIEALENEFAPSKEIFNILLNNSANLYKFHEHINHSAFTFIIDKYISSNNEEYFVLLEEILQKHIDSTIFNQEDLQKEWLMGLTISSQSSGVNITKVNNALKNNLPTKVDTFLQNNKIILRNNIISNIFKISFENDDTEIISRIIKLNSSSSFFWNRFSDIVTIIKNKSSDGSWTKEKIIEKLDEIKNLCSAENLKSFRTNIIYNLLSISDYISSDIIETLINKGMNPDACAPSLANKRINKTPLLLAIEKNNIQAAQIIAQHISDNGININININQDEETVLYKLIKNIDEDKESLKLLQILCQRKAEYKDNIILMALKEMKLKSAILLLDYKNINENLINDTANIARELKEQNQLNEEQIKDLDEIITKTSFNLTSNK